METTGRSNNDFHEITQKMLKNYQLLMNINNKVKINNFETSNFKHIHVQTHI